LSLSSCYTVTESLSTYFCSSSRTAAGAGSATHGQGQYQRSSPSLIRRDSVAAVQCQRWIAHWGTT
jgi:hypothetical protein